MLRSLVSAVLLLLALLWAAILSSAIGSSIAPLETTASPWTQDTPQINTGSLITVTTTTDELISNGDCSLREAIQAAYTDLAVDACPSGSAGDTIILPAGLYQLSLGQLHLSGTVTLQGSVTGTSILDANHLDRVLYIHPYAVVELAYLDIRNGQRSFPVEEENWNSGGEGGGIANFGTTIIAHSTIHDNHAGLILYNMNGSVGADGGGIFNRGVLTITNSTISGNSAGDGFPGWITHGGYTGCGADGEGGGIANYNLLALDNSTVTNNTPGHRTGTLYLYCLPPLSGKVGGVYTQDSGRTYVRNSIFAGNEGSDCGGTIISNGHTIIQSTDTCAITGNFLHWVGYVDPLMANGGPTLTHAVSQKSPAIDAGDCTDTAGITITVDQRGEPRPQGDGCDIGAYESPYTSTFAIGNTSLPRIAFNPSPCTIVNPACNLTNDLLHDSLPSWSPDGTKIAFVRSLSQNPSAYPLSDTEIYVMNADGSATTKLVDASYQLLWPYGFRPLWSPNAKQIIFINDQENNRDIYVVDADGGRPTNLTSTPAINEESPIWSPDSSKILYLQYDAYGDFNPDVYVMNADGSQKTLLAVDATTAGWSPDSTQILYAHLSAHKEFHIVHADGSQHIDIRDDDNVWYQSPMWSPDGSKIASKCDVRILDTYEERICVMNSDDSQRLSFSVKGTVESPPIWSPSGDKLAFQSQLPDRWGFDIWVMNSDGSELTNITLDGDSYGYDILWSPKGTKLLYGRRYDYTDWDGPVEIMVVNVDGTWKRRLTETPYPIYVGNPAWSPDGSKIIYVSGISGNREIYLLGIGE